MQDMRKDVLGWIGEGVKMKKMTVLSIIGIICILGFVATFGSGSNTSGCQPEIGKIVFYSTTQENYYLTMQWGSTTSGSSGNGIICDSVPTNSLGGNDIIVHVSGGNAIYEYNNPDGSSQTYRYEPNGKTFDGVFPSNVDGYYNIGVN